MKTFDLNSVKDSGVHALKTADAVNRLLEAREKTSLRYFPVDLSGVRNKAQLLVLLSESLAFPDYFGRNWDALYDILCDEGWLGSQQNEHDNQRGAIIHLKHSTAFEKQDKDDWQTLTGIFEDAIDFWRASDVPFWVFVDHSREP